MNIFEYTYMFAHIQWYLHQTCLDICRSHGSSLSRFIVADRSTGRAWRKTFLNIYVNTSYVKYGCTVVNYNLRCQYIKDNSDCLFLWNNEKHICVYLSFLKLIWYRCTQCWRVDHHALNRTDPNHSPTPAEPPRVCPQADWLWETVLEGLASRGETWTTATQWEQKESQSLRKWWTWNNSA